MTIYQNTPYTYRIGWTSTGMNYYGVRYAKDCYPSDLFVTYFTSSDYVAAYIKEHGHPDIIEVRRAFTDEDRVNRARLHEHRVLKRMKVRSRDDYLNKSDGISWNLSPEEISIMVKESNKKRVEEGTHNWVGDGTYQRKFQQDRLAAGTHPFQDIDVINKRMENISGKNNWRYDHTCYDLIHEDGRTYSGTQYDFRKMYPDIPGDHLSEVVRDKSDRKRVDGWRLITTPAKPTAIIYHFRHDCGDEFIGTVAEFRKKYPKINKGNLYEVAAARRTKIVGWTIVNR